MTAVLDERAQVAVHPELRVLVAISERGEHTALDERTDHGFEPDLLVLERARAHHPRNIAPANVSHSGASRDRASSKEASSARLDRGIDVSSASPSHWGGFHGICKQGKLTRDASRLKRKRLQVALAAEADR
jgi:hypothetical protein